MQRLAASDWPAAVWGDGARARPNFRCRNICCHHQLVPGSRLTAGIFGWLAVPASWLRRKLRAGAFVAASEWAACGAVRHRVNGAVPVFL